MTTRRPVKERRQLLVGVIASLADLQFAVRMKQPPDLFELRLDCLGDVIDQRERRMSNVKTPLIITARDPREGGINNLSLQQRRDLLLRFLPHAKYVDVELRSARAFKPLLTRARKGNVRVILSFHDFNSTPTSRSLHAKIPTAKKLGADIFKVATHTQKPSDLARLVDFITNNDSGLRLSAMGIGKLGGISRLLLATCGSVLNYTSLGESHIEGQLPIAVLRSSLRAAPR